MVFLRDFDPFSRLRQVAIPSITRHYCSCRMNEAMVETITGTVSAHKIEKLVFGVVVTRVSDCDGLRRLETLGWRIDIITWFLMKLRALTSRTHGSSRLMMSTWIEMREMIQRQRGRRKVLCIVYCVLCVVYWKDSRIRARVKFTAVT